MRIFAARIGHVVRRTPCLLDSRNYLTPNRIVRIVARDQIKKMRSDREREFVAREQNATAFLLAKIEMFFELNERSDPVFELPFPIVPEFRRNVIPAAWRVRDELFPIPVSCRKSDHCKFENKKTLRSLNTVSTQALDRALRTRRRPRFLRVIGRNFCRTSLPRTPTVICRPGRSAPNGNRRDRGTKGPCSSIQVLRDRFRYRDLLYRHRCSSDARALSAMSPCWADETTCGQSSRAMVCP